MSDQQPVAKNILQNYYRQPKIYITLPSHGKFYPAGSLDVSQSGEYPVFAMTAKDELMLKTPDALLNGQATTEVIKSCVPAILDPWKMPSIDIDAVLVAIRIATYGETMEVNAVCPKCEKFNDYELDLTNFLNQVSQFDYKETINVDPLVIHIRPYDYREVTKTAMKAIEQEKIFNIVNDDSLTEDQKLEQFGDSFVKLTELTIEIIADTIYKIDTPEGSTTDKGEIKQFIANAPKDVFQQVNDHIVGLKDQVDLKAQDVECDECKEKYSVAVTLDQANFFDVRS